MLRATDPIAAYIAALPEPRRARGAALDALVRRRFPEAEASLDYRMPTYRRGGEFFAWGGQKRYLSVYTCSAVRLAAFAAKLPAIARGVGCLNFRDTDPFPLRDLAGVIRNALDPPAAVLAAEAAASATRPGSRRPQRKTRSDSRH